MLECSKPCEKAAWWWSSFQRAVVDSVCLTAEQSDFDAGYEDGTKRRNCFAPLARNSPQYRRGYLAALTRVDGAEKQRLLKSVP